MRKRIKVLTVAAKHQALINHQANNQNAHLSVSNRREYHQIETKRKTVK